MNPARFAVRNAVLVHILFFVGVIGGLMVLFGIEVDVFPNVSFAQAKVTTTWLGASSDDVEQFITRRIEEEIDGVQGIDRIVSHSQRDVSLIDVKFREDISQAEYDRYYNDLRSAIERVTDLPDDAEEPLLQNQTVNEIYPIIQLNVVTGDDFMPDADADRRELVAREVAKSLRQDLEGIGGVLKVSDFSIREREFRVVVDPDRLERHGLTVLDVHASLAANHVNLPAGPFTRGAAEISIRSVGEFQRKDALLLLEIPVPGSGATVRLSEIASVTEGFERRTFLSRFNGRPTLNLGVFKREGADSLDLKQDVVAAVEAFRVRDVPDGITIESAIDTTKVIKSRIGVLRNSLLFGIVLVFFLLWLFVGARNSALAVIGVPFSFLLAMMFIEPMDITINAISLFSMVLVSGMIVDDAIIVLENIYRHVERGESIHDAVVVGTKEVTWPVVAATATTLAAFLPMLLMEGVVGVFLSIIPKTVTACLIASLVECFFILPAHYVDWGPKTHLKRSFDTRFDRFRDGYVRILRITQKGPVLVVAACLVLVAGAAGLVGVIPVNLFPSDFQAFYVNLTMESDASLDETSNASREIEAIIEGYLVDEKIEGYTTSVGVTWTSDNQLLLRPNVCQILVAFTDEVANDGDPEALINELRRDVVAHIRSGRSEHHFTGVEVDAFQDGPPTGKPVAVRIESNDYVDAKIVARRVVAELTAMPGVIGIADNLEAGPEEVELLPDRARLAERGVDFRQVALTARAANDGLVAGTIKDPDSDDEIDIRVLIDSRGDDAVAAVSTAEVRLPGLQRVRVGDLVDIDVSQSYLSRYHYDTHRTVLVTADVDSAVTTSAEVNARLSRRLAKVSDEHPGLLIHYGGEFEETQRSFESLGRAALVSLLLIYGILAAQFRSYILPLVVISAVPASFVGVILGLTLLGLPFTILTFIALVGLIGIAVNDSLVLVEFIENSRRAGATIDDAIAEGARNRLRAIILTTATTCFGLLPMALELTGKSKIWSPFAATISFGLIIASTLTLFLVPAVYRLASRLRR